ncbi:MAG: ATP-binding protein [Acidobacteriota bacterium]
MKVSERLGNYAAEHAEEVLKHAVVVARDVFPLSENENPTRIERECRHVLLRILPEEKKPEGEGRLRISFAAYLRGCLAVREGLERALRAQMGPEADLATLTALAEEASRLLGKSVLRAADSDQEKRDADSAKDEAAIRELEGTKGRLQRTIDHLTKLFEYSPDGIVTLDENGTVITLNKAAKSITGYRANEIVGELFTNLLVDAKGARNLFKRMKKRWVSNYETILRHKDGREVPISVSASTLETGEEDASQMMLIFRDLSEVQEMKAQLIENEKLGAMAKIAGKVAHEIRNPLNSLFLNTDLLEDEISRDGQVLSARSQHLLSVVREEIDRLNNIIVNYLSLSKVSALQPELSDVNAFLAEIAREKLPEIEEARVTLEEAYQPDVPQLFIDRSQMRRVIFNLVQNAINAMPDGGRLRVGTREAPGEVVQIFVSDAGVGIAPEHMGNLFNPFFSRLGGGTGLGLYLSREIIGSHQGKVTVKSEPGAGTTVTISLPVLDEWEER